MMDPKEIRNAIAKAIQEKSPQELVVYEPVVDRFKKLYVAIHGKKNSEQFYEAEKFHFLKIISDNKKIADCTKMSLYGCFMDMAVNALSFDPSFKHVYIVPQPFNIGTKDNKVWESRACIRIGGQGELIMRTRSGQIKYADNPIMVFDCDKFTFGTTNRETFVEHTAIFPRPDNAKIIAAYIAITRNDGSIDYKVMGRGEIDNLRKFSKDPNSLAWTDGLEGMIQAKVIKHAFKNYPKVRMGDFSLLASQQIEKFIAPDIEIDEEVNIDYGHEPEYQETKQAAAPEVKKVIKTDQKPFEPETPAKELSGVNFPGKESDIF